ncbi:MAG: hypothetical protein HOQ45_20320 [Nocardioidaceae bacterium]|nr:hypothetical protein [Nocardioidaceae bacterium]
MTLLAEPSVVTDLLPQYNIPAAQLTAAQRMVAGWLKADAALAALPAGLTDGDDLFSPAFELVTLLVTNPELLASKTVGPTSRAWPIAQRRDAIRALVREQAQRAAGGAASGSFPPAPCWPDPALPLGRDWYRSL